MHADKVKRGKPFYGVDLGLLLLDGTIPRARGDIGNARTYSFPVLFDVAAGATGADMHFPPRPEVLDALAQSARRLARSGVKAIMTSCGLMANYQSQLVNAVQIPLASSSLLQIPLILRLVAPRRKIGLLTIDPEALSPAHFESAGISAAEVERLAVLGVPRTSHLFAAITRGSDELDVQRAGDEIVALGQELVTKNPDLAGFVLECTNLSVYAARLRVELGLPVWDAVGLANWLQGAVCADE